MNTKIGKIPLLSVLIYVFSYFHFGVSRLCCFQFVSFVILSSQLVLIISTLRAISKISRNIFRLQMWNVLTRSCCSNVLNLPIKIFLKVSANRIHRLFPR